MGRGLGDVDPRAAGTFLDPVFEFARILRGHPAFEHLEVDQAADLAEAVCPNLWNELPSTTALLHDSTPARVGPPSQPLVHDTTA